MFVSEFFDLCKNNRKLSQKTVVITSDDGYRSDYEVFYPVLKKYGMKGSVNIQTSTLNNTSRHITNAQLEEMAKSGRIEVGAHTHNLHSDKIFQQQGETSAEYQERLKKDFNQSKKILEEVTNKGVKTLALPEGHYNGDIIRASQSVGMGMFLGSQRGTNPLNFCAGTVVLKRAKADISVDAFKKMVDKNFQ